MLRNLFGALFICFLSLAVHAQIISGPMLGQVELRDAKVWIEVSSGVKNVKLVYSKKGSTAKTTISYTGQLRKPFNPIQFPIGGLEPNTIYQYQIITDGKPAKGINEFITKDLWQWRKPAPDFSFITGSCTYVNEPAYDRPGKPYGADSSIFETMAKEKAAFMLWLGDNWYTREVDYYSEWGLWYRAHHDRKVPVLQNLLKAMPHYATWDDHDYGPNDIGGNYILKDKSRHVFKSYWANPSYGENEEGIYTMVSYGDVDIFLCDDRWWRSDPRLKDTINGQPNNDKTMLGAKQMNWLQNSLLHNNATFKIVVVGTQVLNPGSTVDKLLDYKYEYNKLMQFLNDAKIDGVLFLTGDRHHSEVIKVERPGTYPLYDITVSPLTSGVAKFSGKEANNSYRVLGYDKGQNYGRFSFSGPKGQRKLTVEFLGVKGERVGEWNISEAALKTPGQ